MEFYLKKKDWTLVLAYIFLGTVISLVGWLSLGSKVFFLVLVWTIFGGGIVFIQLEIYRRTQEQINLVAWDVRNVKEYVFIDQRDEKRLIKKFPPFKRILERKESVQKELQRFYSHYVSEVSCPVAAISMELSILLLEMCRLYRPKRILDLGSGFSSFVFRYYREKEDKEVTIYSVDDNAGWLEKTKEFLKSQNLPTDHVMEWDLFSREDHEKFDLILHDLGMMDLRQQTLGKAISFANPKGFVVLDDFNKMDYRNFATAFLIECELDYYILRSFTEDHITRYSALVIPS